ncbi:PKD domain-containing protein [Echinicola sp. 20G]|uniref:PKD domain-containing protein n=1 Tax=Echinicola sp. 20G TaxID=2781961 RepID=UPI001910D4C8|nr:PKD domain-containing protein [Echinicola sp. 20G]
MSINLQNITTKYRRFTKNQVLTAGHLNEMVNFFDDQDRLTRICLSGVGIVCGFKVTYDPIGGILEISQGAGVTTDGDLFQLYGIDLETGEKTIAIDSKLYGHYKIHDNEKANYKPYFYDGETQLDMYELLTEEQQAVENDDNFELSTLEANEGVSMDDAVILLYLECYEKEKDLCVSLSCDNQGLEIIGNYKVLLVSKAVAEQINSHDTIISKANYSNLYHQMEDVFANRVVLSTENFSNYDELKKSFTSGTLGNDVVNQLQQGFGTLLTALNMPLLLNAFEDYLTTIFDYTESNTPPDFQYRYDLLKDVIDTYNEIKDILFNMDSGDCCPDIKAFPKHLMLGEVFKEDVCYEYRHGFYKSPILKSQNLSTCTDCLTSMPIIDIGPENTLEEEVIDLGEEEMDICYGKGTDESRLFSLIKRAVQLLANYNANYNFIKITPSFHLGLLSKKAIPFYNNVGNHLIQLWDFDKTLRAKHRNNVGYHNALLNIKEPLEITLDHDFYRIEGHQGRNYKDALSIVEDIRKEHGLGFNVIALGINANEDMEFVEDFTTYYLNKNHGYEHKAGVQPGGTFIMIYVRGLYSAYPYPYGYGYPYEYPGDGSLAGDFEGEADEDEIVVLNPVVADFTLPYLCCGENLVALSLPVEELCFNEETEPIPFHVMPTGGYVEAEVEEGLFGGVTQDDFGAFVFDPFLVSEELYGVPITFTVNNFETDCQITVYRQPVFDFEVDNMDPGQTQVYVQFNIIGDDLIEGQEYQWDFGDGTALVNSTDLSIQHIYLLDNIDGNAVTVTVNTGEGNCALRVEHTIVLDVPVDITLSMDQTEFCRNDESSHNIFITPDDGSVQLGGPGVSPTRNDGGNYFFVPANVPATAGNQITILLDGAASNLTINLLVPPVASFATNIQSGNLIISNNSQNATDFRWLVDGEEILRDDSSDIVRSVSSFNSRTITVSLTATNRLCSASVDGPRTVILSEGPEVRTCLQVASSFIENGSGIINQILEVNDNISGETTEIASFIGSLLKTVQNELEEYIVGRQNGRIADADHFNQEIFNRLLAAARASQSREDQAAIRNLIEIYIGLFYTILRCQEPDVITEFQEIILSITSMINSFLQGLLRLEFNPDPDGTLKEFMNIIQTEFEDSPFLIDEIKGQLEFLAQNA